MSVICLCFNRNKQENTYMKIYICQTSERSSLFKHLSLNPEQMSLTEARQTSELTAPDGIKVIERARVTQ